MSEAKYSPSSSSWLSAGVGLIFSQVEDAMTSVNEFLNQSKETFEELQARGEKIDEKLRQSRQSTSFFGLAKDIVPNVPSFSFLPCQRAAEKRTQELDALSSKVDALIEQVALLAAKRAAQKVAAKQPKEESKATPVTRRKRTTSKASAAAGSSAAVEKKPATRKRASTAKSTTSAATKTKSTTTRASSAKKVAPKPESSED